MCHMCRISQKLARNNHHRATMILTLSPSPGSENADAPPTKRDVSAAGCNRRVLLRCGSPALGRCLWPAHSLRQSVGSGGIHLSDPISASGIRLVIDGIVMIAALAWRTQKLYSIPLSSECYRREWRAVRNRVQRPLATVAVWEMPPGQLCCSSSAQGRDCRSCGACGEPNQCGGRFIGERECGRSPCR